MPRKLLVVLLAVVLVMPVWLTAASAAPAVYASLSETTFSPNGDGFRDNMIVWFSIGSPARVTVRVLDPTGRVVTYLHRDLNLSAGPRAFIWGGTMGLTGGGLIPNGSYIMQVVATDGGGSGSAAVPFILNAGLLGPGLIENGAITRDKIAMGAIDAARIANGSITLDKLAPIAVLTANLADGSVTEAKLGANAVTTSKIADGSITSADIADGAITLADIADGTIGSTDIADGSVATPDLAAGAVTSATILDGSVTGADILDGTVASADIADGAIISADIADGTVGSGDIEDQGVSTADLEDGAVTGAKIAAGAVSQTHAPWAISGNASNLRIESGETTLPTDLSGSAVKSRSISFSSAFSSPPLVLVSFKEFSDILGVSVANLSAVPATDGFTAQMKVTSGYAGSYATISWLAIGN